MRDSVKKGAMAAAMLLLAHGAGGRAEAAVIDSVGVAAASGGSPYLCCFDLTVYNRHDTSVTISEVRLQILSGHGAFVAGASGTPANWTIFQTTTSATWTSSAATADIRSGRSLGGFHICARDTGIVRVLWETRTVDGVLSSDTLLLACRGVDCDQAFAQVRPSSLTELADFDLIAGNTPNRVIDDFHLHSLTAGASFVTTGGAVPAGWIKLRARPDTLSFGAQNGGLTRDRFAEGFRVEFSAPRDAAIRIAWWSTSGGDVICRDTITLRFPSLTRGDSARFIGRGAGDSCCFDLSFKNLHVAGSAIDLVSFALLTPGAAIRANPDAPDGWNAHPLSPARDSVFFTSIAGLSTGDSALFESICLDNSAAASDTIRYRWKSFSRGVPVDAGTGAVFCLRPLTACDSVAASAEASAPGGGRCVALRLFNRNSRATSITRFTAHISNAGTARTVLSASAPPGWHVENFGGDSAIFSGGSLSAGGSAAFSFCVSAGGASTRDPLRIAWLTSDVRGALCSDTVDLDLIIATGCDSARVAGIPSADSSRSCFSISLANPSGSSAVLDSVQLSIGGGLFFISATDVAPWHAGGTLPSRAISFSGGAIPAGASTPPFSFCIDARRLAAPVHVPLIWSTFGGGGRICIDTADIIIAPATVQPCDSVSTSAISATGPGTCVYDFSIRNLHLPPGGFDGVQARIVGGPGVIRNATVNGAGGWSLASLTRTRVAFRGASVASGDSLAGFRLMIDSAASAPVTIEICTSGGDLPLCCSRQTLLCGVASVDLPPVPGAFTLLEHAVDPASGNGTIRYAMSRPGELRLLLYDAAGMEVRRVIRPHESVGVHAIDLDLSDLPSGMYFSTLSSGGEEISFRLMIVR
ncbi:MAG: hypothetical protein JWQ98_3399 [Chlorobi bacterium]|nr:hypothetical protein [Chlorobiota bacterium]